MFQFKQFTIEQSECAMKVGTDGVLLGAWVDIKEAKNILDIGSGTGLISLMIAQRNNDAKITGIEIDTNAIKQSNQNAQRSPWGNRVEFIQGDFRHFLFNQQYEHIVSNPPFFINSLKNPNEQRKTARHTDTLSPETLIKISSNILSPNGKISLIYPTDIGESIISIAHKYNLYCTRKTKVYPRKDLPIKRLLIELSNSKGNCQESEITIEEQRHIYTKEYITLTKDFYLKM